MDVRSSLTKLFSVLLLSVLLGGPLVTLAARPAAPVTVAHTDPALLQLAAAEPGAELSVIVQKSTLSPDVEGLVGKLGGTVTRNLAIINGFSATVPASAIATLARAEGVKWLSLDAPVEQANASNRYYLHSNGTLSESAPTVESLEPGADGLHLPRTESQAVRWQIGPFANDVQLQNKVEFKLYAAAVGFQERSGTVQATLRQGGWQVTETLEGGWSNKWKRETIKFENVDHLLPAGQILELVVLTAPSSASDMMLAFDTEEQESHLQMTLLDPLIDLEKFYLASSGTGATASQAVLPVTLVEPQGNTLYNYDTNRDSREGLLIQRGGSGGLESNPAKIQKWKIATFSTNTQLPLDFKLQIYLAMKNFRKSYGKVWVHLLDVDESGQSTVIGSLSASDVWDR